MDHCHGGTFDEFLVSKPKEVSLFDLIRLLYTGDVCANNAIDCPDGTDKIHRKWRRWVLAMLLFVQMVLLALETPMAKFGSALEKWLNCFHMNKSSFKKFFANFLKGDKSCPDKNSSDFRSIIGILDRRIQLDTDIKPADNSKYHAHLSIMAAKIAYENENAIKTIVTDKWKMEFLKYFNCYNEFEKETSTEAFMFCDKPVDANLVVIAFCGTKPFNAVMWCTDIDFSWYKINSKKFRGAKGKIHGGFMKALGLQKENGWPKEIKSDNEHLFAYYAIREQLREVLKRNENAKFLITGHSLGGALAILFPSILALHGEEDLLKRLEGVYTFGQPRVGDAEFGMFVRGFLDKPQKRYFRFVYGNDMVPRIPFDDKTLLFKHIDDCFYYNSLYRGMVLKEQPNKNYFSPLALIPKYLTATFEFIRSFVIGFVKGPDYNEGWLLRFARLFALIVPGLTPHCPQDYVNCTRLGNLIAIADKRD